MSKELNLTLGEATLPDGTRVRWRLNAYGYRQGARRAVQVYLKEERRDPGSPCWSLEFWLARQPDPDDPKPGTYQERLSYTPAARVTEALLRRYAGLALDAARAIVKRRLAATPNACTVMGSVS